MSDQFYIQVIGGTTYMPIREMTKRYCQSHQTIRRILAEIEECDRYKNRRICINEFGDKMVNILIYEDYLFYRSRLKHKNLARKLPPYDPVAVRREWGEYQIPIYQEEKHESCG